jgi:hypothetical protein
MPRYAWYRERSRAGVMSPTIAWISELRPPPPTPCRARNAIGIVMLWAVPQNAEPARKTTTENRKIRFRPYMSPSLPNSSVAIALVGLTGGGIQLDRGRNPAVATQEIPPRSCRLRRGRR